MSCVNKSSLDVTKLAAYCKVSAFGSQHSFGFSCLFSFNPLENKSYASIRTEALSVIQLLLTKLQGENFLLATWKTHCLVEMVPGCVAWNSEEMALPSCSTGGAGTWK